MRRALLTAAGGSIVLPAIGDAFMGGYYAGIIDTTKGNIIAADASQTGARYALIVAPNSLATGSADDFQTTGGAAPSATRTRWDGLSATTAMNGPTYPAAYYCYGLSYPADAASPWYLPAMDELELAYRNLKPVTSASSTSTVASLFPGSHPTGTNLSSDPQRPAYASAQPSQTTVAAFQSGSAEAFSGSWYRTSTEAYDNQGWRQFCSTGNQSPANKSGVSSQVRPVRRLLL